MSQTTIRNALRGLLCLAATPMLMGSECEQPLVKDSGFDVWCGNTLCDWQVDQGGVAKVPTWNASDYGVALVGDPATISQTLAFTSDDVSCIHFDLLANVDESATVTLTLDFDDGSSGQSMETIPSGAWTPISYHLTTPTYFRSLRISITKVGGGQAELAQIQASKASDCSGPPPVGALDRPAGATCEIAIQCAGSPCIARTTASELIPDGTVRQVCASCTSDGDCTAGSVCGLGWSSAFIEPYPACAPAATAVLGDRCLVDSECASGSCCNGICSTCCATAGAPACAAGQACAARAQNADGKPLRTAWQCAPDQARGAAGSPCLANDDCASAACTGGGPLSVCAADGRRCAIDTDCPDGASGNPCIAIGVAGGKCQ